MPTHVSAIAQFVDGGVSQSVFSFDSPLAQMGVVEITGTEGTLVIPDPNMFTGEVKITRAPALERMRQEPEWEIVPTTGVYAGRGRSPRPGPGDPFRRRSRSPRASSATTCSTRWSPSTRPWFRPDRRGGEPGRAVPLVAEDWDPFAATL